MTDDINERRSVAAAQMIVKAQNKLISELQTIAESRNPVRFERGVIGGPILFEIQEISMLTPDEVSVKGYNLTSAEFVELATKSLISPSIEKALICRHIDVDAIRVTVIPEHERLEWYRNKFLTTWTNR